MAGRKQKYTPHHTKGLKWVKLCRERTLFRSGLVRGSTAHKLVTVDGAL